MRKQPLRKTTLLSLLGLTTSTVAQSSSTWGEPFSVDIPSESTVSLLPSNPPLGSTENVVPTDTLVSVRSSIFPTDVTLTDLSSETASFDSSLAFSVTLPTPTGSGTTVSTPMTEPTISASSGGTSRRSESSGEATSGTGSAAGASSTGAGSTGGAAPAATAYAKMGVVGVLVGAAGVLL